MFRKKSYPGRRETRKKRQENTDLDVFRQPCLKLRIERAGGGEEQTGLDIMRNSIVMGTDFQVLLWNWFLLKCIMICVSKSLIWIFYLE